jgi:hypothetical protein
MFENQFVYNRFLNISIKYAYILKSSIRETLNKICKIAQCVISKDDNGDIKIFDARPVCESVNQILSIPLKIQYSLPQINYIKKNKYDKVTINYNETSYEYSELKQIPFAIYETPAFGLAVDEKLNKQFSALLNNDFNSFQEIYSKSNKELSYIAFGIPYQDNNYWRYSLCKINIPKGDIVTTYNEFKLMITGDSLSGLLVYDSDGKAMRMVVNETDSVNVTKTFVCNSEDEVIDTFFNRSSNGKISSVKVSGYNYSIAVVKGDVSNTYYIFKLDAILSERGIESVPYYNGNFTIYNKIINQESKEYEQGIGDNFITIESNELMTNNVNVSDDKDYSIMEYVSQNILNDYSSGVNSVNLTISCSDMFDTNGNLVIDFAQGQILQIGDIVRIDKDNNGTSLWFYDNGTPMYWRVTGRNFRKVGVPMIDLELQEVRVVD